MSVPPGHPVQPAAEPPSEQPVCVRHPDRSTGLRCTRCERPSCPECLREAAVGYQCVDCVADGRRTAPRLRTVAGATVSRRTVVVPFLILVNVAIYLWTAVEARSGADNYRSALFLDWSLWPPAVAVGEWWRLFTSGFLHFGPLHLAFNMFALWIIGRDLERVLGWLRFSAVYLLSLLGGSAAVFLFGEVDTWTAGASGAVFGLMAGVTVAAVRLRFDPRPALTVIALNLFLSITLPGISLLGHLGGLVIGAVATAGLVYAPQRRRTQVQVAVLFGLLVLLVVLFVVRDATYPEVVCIGGDCLQLD
ncbi:MAG TPA: rhomboid family intramembrane serine protease [Pseudonocardiaceae bacterium]